MYKKKFERKNQLAVIVLTALFSLLCCYIFVSQNTFEYTNLVDDASRVYVQSILEEVGVSQKNADVFFQLVNKFYQDPYANTVESGFQKAIIPFFSYKDTDAARHLELQPDDSLSCRMAAFILLRDSITFSDNAENRPDLPELKEKDPSSRKALSDSDDLLHYDLLFANLTNQTVHSSAEMSAALTEY